LGTDADKDGYYTADSCSYLIEKGIDCNDKDRAVFPSKKEVCNDTKDNDCDNQVDGNDTDCGGTPVTDPFEPNNTCGDVANDDLQEVTSTIYDAEAPEEANWELAVMEASIDKPGSGDDEDWFIVKAKESGWDASCIPIIDSADCFFQCLDIAVDLNLPAQADTDNWEICFYEMDGSCSNLTKIGCSTSDDVVAWMNEAGTDIVGFSYLLPLYYWDGMWGLNDDRSFAIQVKPKTAGALTGNNPYSVYVTVGKQAAGCPTE